MRIQAISVVLLLLLVALLHGAECDVARYTRKVKGRILGKNVLKPSELIPVPNGFGSASCEATVIYITPSKKYLTRVIKSFASWTAGAKGLYSSSILFLDNDFTKGDKVTSFQVSCVITSGITVPVKKTATASGSKDINGGDIVSYWAVPLQVKGSLACERSGKPISSTAWGGLCTLNFVPKVSEYQITIGSKTRKDGSFSTSAVPYFEGDKVPLTGRFTKVTVTCEMEYPPAGTKVVKANKPVVINSANYNLGKVILQDQTQNKRYCKP